MIDAIAVADIVARSVPLVLAGLAVAVAFRAGVFNIGAEGQLLAGAAAAAAIALALGDSVGPAAVVIALLGGALAGSVWAGIAAVLRVKFGVLEVISTIMLNFVALYGVGYLVRGPLQEPLRIYPQTASIHEAARLPALIPGTRLHAGALLAVVVAVVAWWVLRSTAAGFRVRAAGASPRAARTAGSIDVGRVTTGAFLMSGAIAGLAGAVEVAGITFALYENISPGYGYAAIAVALVARLNPLAVIAAGVFFGALDFGATTLQRDAGIPSVWVYVAQAAAILVVLAFRSMREREMPAAAPEPRSV